MARPMSDGVGYFPKDTSFYEDDKIKLLRAEFGAKGMYLLDYILCELYKKDGYFMKWDRNKCYLVSDGAGCGCSPGFVDEVIVGCVRCEIFDKSVFEAYGVITSAGIQRRYVRMFNGRDYIRIIKEYFLLNVNDKKDIPGGILEKCVFFSVNTKENPNKSTENPVKTKENPSKERKEEEIKESSFNLSIACTREDEAGDEDATEEREAEKLIKARRYLKMPGMESVMLSEEQIGALLEELSLEEYHKYVAVVAECEKRGKKYKKKTHYQAIRDMALKDRSTK